MKFVHTIQVSVFVKPGEDEEKIRESLSSLAPFDLEEEKVALKKTVAKGVDEFSTKITIYELMLEKERHTRKFIEHLLSRLSTDQKKMLLRQEDRLGDDCCFYLRLDKQKLLDKEAWITDLGDCFHVKMTIAAFPKKKEAARTVVEKMLS
ncbi:hypothetical protein JW826_02310 [Candidatus Woesearchaeota archaeon]|nr:hypothetical protein [Candidatus Woesearchaeota archaeon]